MGEVRSLYEYSVGGQNFRTLQEERSLKLLKSRRELVRACLGTGPGDSRNVQHRRGTVKVSVAFVTSD